MVLRSTYPGYLEAVQRYFAKVLELLGPLQSVNGGPIIAFQIENEYADYFRDLNEGRKYMSFLYKVRDVKLEGRAWTGTWRFWVGTPKTRKWL